MTADRRSHSTWGLQPSRRGVHHSHSPRQRGTQVTIPHVSGEELVVRSPKGQVRGSGAQRETPPGAQPVISLAVRKVDP